MHLQEGVCDCLILTVSRVKIKQVWSSLKVQLGGDTLLKETNRECCVDIFAPGKLVNGTILLVNGPVLLVNGTILLVNGAVLLVNGAVLLVNGAVGQYTILCAKDYISVRRMFCVHGIV